MFRFIMVLVFLAPLSASADSLRRETLREYLAVVDAYGQMKATMPLLVAPLTDMVLKSQEKRGIDAGLNAKQNAAGLAVMRKHVESAVTTTVSRFGEMLSSKELEDIYFPVMQEHYTEEDVKSLTAFYRTPLGKKSLGLVQVIQSKTFSPIQQLVSTRTEAIFGEEMRKRREVAVNEMTKAIDNAR